MDRLEAMTTLLAAVEAGSLSGASRLLGAPLSTVSRRVADLEAHLRTRLVTRGSRRLILTDAGRDYVAACQRILADIEEAEQTAIGEYRSPRGDLTITAPVAFGRIHVLPILAAFIKAYPEIDVRLTLADRVFNLIEEHVDVALRIGDLPESSLVATRLGSIRLITCASAEYFAARGLPESPEQLAAHDCITFEGATLSKTWTFQSGKRELAVPIRSRLVVNTAEAAVDAAIASIGVTRVLSYQAAAAIGAGTLVVALHKFEPPSIPVSLVQTGRSLLPVKVRAFLDFAAPRLKAALREQARA